MGHTEPKHWSSPAAKLLASLSIFAAFSVAMAANAQAAPANDDFLNATPLAGLPLSVEFDDNEGATKQTGEPDHAGNAGGHSVWYSWTPSKSVHVEVGTCTIGGNLDSLLAVYTGSAVNALTPVASNDDRVDKRCNSTDSKVGFDASAGTTYMIAVDGKDGSEGGFGLWLKEQPENDDFANAQVLGGSLPISATGSTVLATKEAGEPDHAGDVGGHSVWYSWTPSSSGRVEISAACSYGGTLNTLLAVYTGSAVDGLTPVASDDGPGCFSGNSEVTFAASAGTTYMIAVDGRNGGEGSFDLQLQDLPASEAIETLPPGQALPPAPPPLISKPRPRKCRRGFKKKVVHGKRHCVKKRARKKKRHRRHHRRRHRAA